MNEALFPIGIPTFEKIRNEGRYYVDKTLHVYRLAHTDTYYFLSRPRRFGKSLLVSTLDAYFSGRKELFEGLAIAGLEHDWAEYPVLHLDLTTGKYTTVEALESALNMHLEKWEARYGDTYRNRPLAERFLQVVELAYRQTGRQVVILVDEYDKPLLSTILNEPLQDHYRAQLKAFYSVLKSQDPYIRFALLTGVTKFGKVSIFSDLNNLKDISMLPEYADICGITEQEIHQYFEPQLHALATANGLSYEEACNKLRQQYDGYHFALGTPGIYNPFSLLNSLQDRRYGDYWFETGTPTFLVELLRRHHYHLEDLTRERVAVDTLNSMEAMAYNPIPVIYQSGYLTLCSYNPRFKKYTLAFPNREVEEGFIKFLLPTYIPVRRKTVFDIEEFVADVEEGRPEDFARRLQAMMADISYQTVGDTELYFHNVLYVLFKLLGFYVEMERETSYGRMDLVIQTADYVYIVECKLDKSAREALQQIEDKQYAAPFAADRRKLYRIGVNFCSATRSISEYEIV